MSKTALISIGAAAVILVGSGVYLTVRSSPQTLEQSVVVADQPSEEYSNYLKDTAEKLVEEEYGIPMKGEIAKPTIENTKDRSGVWSLAISVNSLGADIFLAESKDETPWMNHVRFDRELTEFEKTEKAKFAETRATWQQIIDSAIYSAQMIEKIQTEFIPQFEAKKDYLSAYYKSAHGVVSIIEGHYGQGVNNVPTKYKVAYQYNKDLELITEALINLIDMNLKAKQQTIKAIQNKQPDAAVIAANDEDRTYLVIGWHEERFLTLEARHDEIQTIMEDWQSQ